MTFEIKRRSVLQMLAFGAAGGKLLAGASVAWAQGADSVTIGWPSDVPSWDPNQRFTPDAQPIFKMVFDQPLDQSPTLEIIPSLITKWELAPDGLSMPVEMRDDVMFHNGEKMTTEDFRYTFFERIKAGHKLDTANSWRKVTDIEIASPDQRRHEVQLALLRPRRNGWRSSAASSCRRSTWRRSVLTRSAKSRSAPAHTSSSNTSSTPASCWSATTIIGDLSRRSGASPSTSSRTFRARRRDPVRPGRPDHQRAGARGRAPAASDPKLAAENQSDHPRDPAAGAQRSRLRRPERAACRASRHRQGTRCRRRSTAAPRCRSRWWRRPARPGYVTDFKFAYDSQTRPRQLLAKSGFSPGQAGEDQVRRHQRALPERLRHRARDRADVEEGRHRGRARDDRIREIFRAQPRRQAARGDALQLGQRHRRPGDLRRLSAQPEDAVLGLEGHGSRREGARAVQRAGLREAHRRLSGAQQGGGRGRRHHPAAAERADASCARRT